MKEQRNQLPTDLELLQEQGDENAGQNENILLYFEEEEDEEQNQDNIDCENNNPIQDEKETQSSQQLQQQLMFPSDEYFLNPESKNQLITQSAESFSSVPILLSTNQHTPPHLQNNNSNNQNQQSQVQEAQTVDYNLKLIELEIQTNKKLIEQIYLDNEEDQPQFKAQLKGSDFNSNGVFKNLLIFNHPKELFQQLQTYPFLLQFRKIEQSHVEQCLFNREDDFKKKSFQLKAKYHLIRTEDGEYHGQANSYSVPEGYGIMYYSNGTQYKGMFKNRHRHGQGKLVYPDGSSYQGNWERDIEEGFGRHIDSDGEIFEGTYVNGNREGKGKLIWTNGYELEGIWRDGLADGKSTLIVGREIMPVIWNRGKIVQVNNTPIENEKENTMRGKQNLFPKCLILINVKRGSVDIQYE